MLLLNVSALESAYNTINSHVKHQKHMPPILITSRAPSLWMQGTTVTLVMFGSGHFAWVSPVACRIHELLDLLMVLNSRLDFDSRGHIDGKWFD